MERLSLAGMLTENQIILKKLRSYITKVTEPLHSDIQKITEDLSVKEKTLVFRGWGEPAHSFWLYDDALYSSMPTDHYIHFNNKICTLQKHPKYKHIFAVHFNITMAALLPGHSEEQVLQELKKRIMLL